MTAAPPNALVEAMGRPRPMPRVSGRAAESLRVHRTDPGARSARRTPGTPSVLVGSTRPSARRPSAAGPAAKRARRHCPRQQLRRPSLPTASAHCSSCVRSGHAGPRSHRSVHLVTSEVPRDFNVLAGVVVAFPRRRLPTHRHEIKRPSGCPQVREKRAVRWHVWGPRPSATFCLPCRVRILQPLSRSRLHRASNEVSAARLAAILPSGSVLLSALQLSQS